MFPEDRTRYDELVYSRDPYLSERDRHRVSISLICIFICSRAFYAENTIKFYLFTFFRNIAVMAFVRIEEVNNNLPELNTDMIR